MMELLKRLSKFPSRAKEAFAGVRKDVDDLRAALIEKRLERNRIERAPVSTAEVEARVDKILSRAEGDFYDGWSDSWFSTPPRAADLTSNEEDLSIRLNDRIKSKPMGTLIFLGQRDSIRAALIDRALSGLPVEAAQVTPAERAKAIADIDADIRQLEVAEEKIIREAELAGIAIPRREDASPEIFLSRDEDLK